jgi:hypothetical protein
MKRSNFCLLAIFIIVMSMVACNKSNTAITPPVITPTLKDSLIGTYKVTSVLFTNIAGQAIQLVQDTGCLSDNQVKLDTTVVSFIDAGVSCGLDYGGNWSLVNDSLRVTGVHYTGSDVLQTTWYNLDQLHYSPEADGGKIVSFDGTNLILTGSPDGSSTVISTWVKL